MAPKRLFIVSNRLPVIISDDHQVMPVSGGLVSAISGYLRSEKESPFSAVFWCGTPGCSEKAWETAIEKEDQAFYEYLPVFVGNEQYEGYYNGYANSTLWPLFHYFPSYAEYVTEHYNHYQQVNVLFAAKLINAIQPGDTIWIHDYHCLPLAGLLREAFPDLTIGFFLHIPFPSYEIIRLMPRPWQENLLNGLLGADLVGFHTIDYANHFLQCIQMVVGVDHDRNVIRYQDRLIKVDVFPVSIDFEHFHDYFDHPDVCSQRITLLTRAEGKKIIFSVDRLDYTKGVNNRLKAYEYFLNKHPEYLEKVVFVLVIVPSRDTIPKYAERKRTIDETISRINSRIGNVHWQPVIYQYNHLSFNEMMAFYTSTHLALITPLRDGMNLVAKEFVASRKDKRGVLVLSEMAGAARELTEALIINPNDTEEMAAMIHAGLQMPEQEQQRRMENMQSRIAYYNVKTWAGDFLNELKNIKMRQKNYQVKFLDERSRDQLLTSYKSSKRRLLLLDYDGTLVGFSSDPFMSMPDVRLLHILEKLNTVNNDLFIISGRSSTMLDKWFSLLNINIIAEHGARFKWKGEKWTSEVMVKADWKAQIEQIMISYVRRCVNTFIEEKEFSMVWHYRNAHPDQGKLRADELISELTDIAHLQHLEVTPGNKIVEVRNSGVDKGMAINKVLARREYDFILAVGDDTTDEDMFKMLAADKKSYTIKVGSDPSFAHYNLPKPQAVISLLEALADAPVSA